MDARRRAAGRFAPSCLALLLTAAAVPECPAQTVVINVANPYPTPAPAPAPPLTAAVEVRLPGEAELWFDGTKMPQTGDRRLFTTPPLHPGVAYTYDVFARWRDEGRDVARGEHLTVRAGESLLIDFTQPPPHDLGPGHMAVREIAKRGAPAPAPAVPGPAPQPPARRLPGYVSVLDFYTPLARSPAAADSPMPVPDLGAESAVVPVTRTRGPGYMLIMELGPPPR